MWAKLRGFPAWPAQVLSSYAGHQSPPRPRPQCVLVHFFGTYDIQWLENEKKARAAAAAPHATRERGAPAPLRVLTRARAPAAQICPLSENFEQYLAACKQKARSLFRALLT